MLKVAGSIIIVTASIGIAQTIRKELAEHLRLLYELRKLLVDIAYAAFESMQPVEILLGCFIRTRDERLNRLCKEIAERLIEKKEGTGEEVWRSVFAEYRKGLQLNDEEAEVIESAGSAFFGKSVDENRKHLSLALERLDFLIETARGEQKEKQKVYGTVSVLCGLMLVILLV